MAAKLLTWRSTTTAHSNYAIRNYRHITGCTISTIVHDEMKSIPYYANHGNVHVQLILRIFIQKKMLTSSKFTFLANKLL